MGTRFKGRFFFLSVALGLTIQCFFALIKPRSAGRNRAFGGKEIQAIIKPDINTAMQARIATVSIERLHSAAIMATPVPTSAV